MVEKFELHVYYYTHSLIEAVVSDFKFICVHVVIPTLNNMYIFKE